MNHRPSRIPHIPSETHSTTTWRSIRIRWITLEELYRLHFENNDKLTDVKVFIRGKSGDDLPRRVLIPCNRTTLQRVCKLTPSRPWADTIGDNYRRKKTHSLQAQWSFQPIFESRVQPGGLHLYRCSANRKWNSFGETLDASLWRLRARGLRNTRSATIQTGP